MLALALVIAIALSLMSPYFLKTANLLNLLDQSVVTGIVSIGMTFVILTGGIDLSVGSLVGLTGVILGLSLHQFPIPVAIALAVLSGAGIGLFSGFVIAYFDLAAFVITLGVMAIGRSLAYIFSGQTSISDIPASLNDLVYTTVLRHTGQRADAASALRSGVGLFDLHEGRPDNLCNRLQSRGRPHGRAERTFLQRRALCRIGRALRHRGHSDVFADPLHRSARGHGCSNWTRSRRW